MDFIEPDWFNVTVYPYDPPLSEEGYDRANSLVAAFAQIPIDRIWTSPFLRTIQTAAPLAKQRNLPIQLEWGLCEWLCQDWTAGLPETTPVDELLPSYPNIDAAYKSLVLPCYPETIDELDARLTSIAHKLIHHNCQHLLAIAHKGSVVGIAAALTGDAGWLAYDLPCGGIIKLVGDRQQWHSSVVER